jgi:hypothetical protein
MLLPIMGYLKPQFVSEIKEWNKTIVKMKKKSFTDMFNRNITEIKAVLRMCG